MQRLNRRDSTYTTGNNETPDVHGSPKTMFIIQILVNNGNINTHGSSNIMHYTDMTGSNNTINRYIQPITSALTQLSSMPIFLAMFGLLIQLLIGALENKLSLEANPVSKLTFVSSAITLFIASVVHLKFISQNTTSDLPRNIAILSGIVVVSALVSAIFPVSCSFGYIAINYVPGAFFLIILILSKSVTSFKFVFNWLYHKLSGNGNLSLLPY